MCGKVRWNSRNCPASCSMALPRNAEWRDAFVSELAAFSVGEHDLIVDAFVHVCKVFVSSGDFKPTVFLLTPGSTRPQSNAELIDEFAQHYLDGAPAFAISPDLDAADDGAFQGEYMSGATYAALERMRRRQ